MTISRRENRQSPPPFKWCDLAKKPLFWGEKLPQKPDKMTTNKASFKNSFFVTEVFLSFIPPINRALAEVLFVRFVLPG